MKKKLTWTLMIIMIVGFLLSVLNNGVPDNIWLMVSQSGHSVILLEFTFFIGLCFYRTSWNLWVNLSALALCVALLYGGYHGLKGQDLATWKIILNLMVQAVFFVCGFIWEQLPWKEEVDETEGL